VSDTAIKVAVPAVSWRGSRPLCGECLHVIARSSGGAVVPGHQTDCYACRNHLTAVSTAETPATSYTRSCWVSGYRGGTTIWKIAGVLFSTQRRSLHSRASWLEVRQCSSFEKGAVTGVEWQSWCQPGFKRPGPDGVAYFKIEDGVVGMAVSSWAPEPT
jgi:hypothetical protein